MLVEWLFKVITEDTIYTWSTKDTEFNNEFYLGIVDSGSFTGISESQSSGSGVITPADVSFSVVHTNSVLKDDDFFNILDDEDVIDSQSANLIENKFFKADAEISLLVDGVLDTSWKFKVKRVEQFYKKAVFYLENVLISYLEGFHPSSVHPREVWKTEYERSDDYVIPTIFGKAYIPLRSIYNFDTRYYVLGKDLYTYTIDRVSSPKEWGNQSFWDDSFSYPQSSAKGYQLFQAIIADSDGDEEVDANGLWKEGDFFLDMSTRVTSDEIPATSEGASPADVLIHFFKDCGIPEELIDISGTFESARSTYTAWGLYWNGGFYQQQPRDTRLSNLLSQCNSTIRITDKIKLYPYTTTPITTITSSDIVKNSYSSRPSWPEESDGGYILYSQSENIPQDRPAEALVWSTVDQASAEDVENPSSNKLDLSFIRDSILAQQLGIIHYNKELNIRGSVSFNLVPTAGVTKLSPDRFITIDDDIYGNTEVLYIKDITLNKDLSVSVEATKFNTQPIGIEDLGLVPEIVIPEEDQEDYWYPSTVDTLTPNRSVNIFSDFDVVRFRREDDPYELNINLSVVVQEIDAHDGVYLEIDTNSGSSIVEMVEGSTVGTYNYQYPVGAYEDFPIIFNATAYKLIDTYKDPILSSSKAVNAIIDGEQGYSINLSKGSYQILCDWKGTPLINELGVSGHAYTEISILKGLDALVPAASSPAKGEFSVEILTGEGCVGGKLADNKTAYIDSVSADSGYLPIKIYLESPDRFIIQQFSFVKSLIGRRGSIEYSADTDNSTAAADWADGTISDTTAQHVADLVLNLPENQDGNIVPGDRVTLQDYYDEKVIAQRIYLGVTKVSGDTFTHSDWSSIVTETIDGSLVVKGTLAADSLVADDTLTNNLTVGSVLNVGDATYTNAIIKSYGYDSGVTGWAIKADGTAEFNEGTFRGDLYIGNPSNVRSDINVADGADVTSASDFVQNTYPADKQALQDQIDGKIDTWYTSTDPSVSWSGTDAEHTGDMWWNTSTNKLKRWLGISWSAELTDQTAIDAFSNAATAQDTADGKRRVFVSTPTPPYDTGDLWDRGEVVGIWRCNTTQSSSESYSVTHWQRIADTTSENTANDVYNIDGTPAATVLQDITNAQTAANNAQATADGKVTTFYQANTPTAEGVGDLWIDTDNGNKLFRWSGSSWLEVQDDDIQSALSAASTAQSTADGKIVSFHQDTAPTPEGIGDLWYDTNDENKPYWWSGSSWISVENPTQWAAIGDETGTKPDDNADVTKGAIDQGIGLNNSSSAFLASGNYSLGELGWKVTGEGDAEFNSADVRGNVSASSFTCGGSFLTANAASGTSTLYLSSTYDFPSSGSGWILGSYNDKDAFSWTSKASDRLTGCTGVLQHPGGSVVIPKAPNIVLDKDSKELRVYGYNTSGSNAYSTTDQLVTLGIKDVGDGGSGEDNAIARFGNETFSRGAAAYFENKKSLDSNGYYETVSIRNYATKGFGLFVGASDSVDGTITLYNSYENDIDSYGGIFKSDKRTGIGLYGQALIGMYAEGEQYGLVADTTYYSSLWDPAGILAKNTEGGNGINVRTSGGYEGIEVVNNDDIGHHAIWARSDYIGVRGGGDSYAFYADGTYGPFTGTHDAFLATDITINTGDIVKDKNILFKDGLSDTITEISKTSSKKEKSVTGVFKKTVYLNKEAFKGSNITSFSDFLKVLSVEFLPNCVDNYFCNNSNVDNWETLRDELIDVLNTYDYCSFNALGEGQINVCSEGGNIEIGDYICSSSTPGKGMKQDDDLLHNYTVAKSRENVTWTQEEIDNNVIKMVACTYHCG